MGPVFGSCFVRQCYIIVSFLVLQSSNLDGDERVSCFTLIVFLISDDC